MHYHSLRDYTMWVYVVPAPAWPEDIRTVMTVSPLSRAHGLGTLIMNECPGCLEDAVTDSVEEPGKAFPEGNWHLNSIK